jgi:hypothetical protein
MQDPSTENVAMMHLGGTVVRKTQLTSRISTNECKEEWLIRGSKSKKTWNLISNHGSAASESRKTITDLQMA